MQSTCFADWPRLPHVVFFDSAMRHPTAGPLFVRRGRSGRVARRAGRRQRRVATSCGSARGTAELRRGRTCRRFKAAWAGLFGYELGRSLEEIPAAAIDEFQIPALAVGLYDVVVAFDHEQSAAWLISQGFPETDPQARRERAAARLAEFRDRLSGIADSNPAVRRPNQPPLSLNELARNSQCPQPPD